jgi:hypothetical protein
VAVIGAAVGLTGAPGALGVTDGDDVGPAEGADDGLADGVADGVVDGVAVGVDVVLLAGADDAIGPEEGVTGVAVGVAGAAEGVADGVMGAADVGREVDVGVEEVRLAVVGPTGDMEEGTKLGIDEETEFVVGFTVGLTGEGRFRRTGAFLFFPFGPFNGGAFPAFLEPLTGGPTLPLSSFLSGRGPMRLSFRNNLAQSCPRVVGAASAP